MLANVQWIKTTGLLIGFCLFQFCGKSAFKLWEFLPNKLCFGSSQSLAALRGWVLLVGTNQQLQSQAIVFPNKSLIRSSVALWAVANWSVKAPVFERSERRSCCKSCNLPGLGDVLGLIQIFNAYSTSPTAKKLQTSLDFKISWLGRTSAATALWITLVPNCPWLAVQKPQKPLRVLFCHVEVLSAAFPIELARPMMHFASRSQRNEKCKFRSTLRLVRGTRRMSDDIGKMVGDDEDEEEDETAGNADQSWRCGNTSIRKWHNKTNR